MDANTSIAVVGGSVSLASIVIGLIIWSLKRNVSHEDAWKQATAAKLERIEKEFAEFKQATALREQDTVTKIGHLATNVGQLQGLIQQLNTALDNGRDKQAQFYREGLAKLEHDLRQELARHVRPEVPERVTALEQKLAVLEASKLRRLPRRPAR